MKSSGVSRLSYKEGDETSIVGGDALGQLEVSQKVCWPVPQLAWEPSGSHWLSRDNDQVLPIE